MIISKLSDNQMVGKQADVWGIYMRDDVTAKGVATLDVGTVLIAKFSEELNIMFETSTRINLLKIRGVDIVYAIPGSRIPMKQESQNIARVADDLHDKMCTKNICFRDCRLPTEKEYNAYRFSETV